MQRVAIARALVHRRPALIWRTSRPATSIREDG
jgi:ABC-type thiamine transport system ATPase subunit